jgi:succinyl-diaminopimelate desuccinylase
MNSTDFLMALLAIPSPTYQEKVKCDFISNWVNEHLPMLSMERLGNNLIISSDQSALPTLAFVGHTDTVPAFFEPYKDGHLLHGSGASDMQGGLACMLTFIYNNLTTLLKKYRVMIIIYDKEEGTPLHENGLFELIQEKKAVLSDIDVAIVGEPTNNTVQLGCVGSLHYTLKVKGKAAHSARPWHGENALYKALPIIQYFSTLTPVKQQVFGVDFFDVMTITESSVTPGRTTVPDEWTANINYRFSPVHALDDAHAHVKQAVESCGVAHELTCLNAVNAGRVIDHPILTAIQSLVPIEAKQAWTDVAQLTELGICAFNFGPGRQDQAHMPNECIDTNDMNNYEIMLNRMLLGG